MEHQWLGGGVAGRSRTLINSAEDQPQISQMDTDGGMARRRGGWTIANPDLRTIKRKAPKP